MPKFWNFIKNEESEAIELRVEGEIISDEWAWFYDWWGDPYAAPNAFRQELSEYKGKDITVWIDSWGGDVFAGIGIYNALKSHRGKVIVKIDGKAVSAGSIIAMAGDEVLMSPGSIMMIHNVWGSAVGEAKDMRKQADVFDEIKEGLLNIYQSATGKTREELSRLMDEETWMSANKAVADGFATGVLYTETQTNASNSYSFSRTAVMNSADSVMQRFFDELKNRQAGNGNQTPATIPEETSANNRISSIKMRVSVREKMNRRHTQ